MATPQISITSPTAGSLKVQDGGVTSYYANLKTVTITADNTIGNCVITNANGFPILTVAASNVASIAASAFSYNAQQVADRLSSLIITT